MKEECLKFVEEFQKEGGFNQLLKCITIASASLVLAKSNHGAGVDCSRVHSRLAWPAH